MEKLAGALAGGGVFALLGAALSNTAKGKLLDESLQKAFDLFDTRVSKHLNIGNFVKKILEEK